MMNKIIVPLYGAAAISCRLSDNPSIIIEPWNRQVKSLKMKTIGDEDKEEDIPDAVAILEGDIDGNVIVVLERNGLDILPLIFERPYYVYQIANEEEITGRMSVPFSIDGGGNNWIRPNRLDDFLKIAVNSYRTLNLGFALNLHYEINFRTSASDVQLILHELLLEYLSKKFIEPIIKNPLSNIAIQAMLEIASDDIVKSGYTDSIQSARQCDKYNKIKQNLTLGLSEKSNRKMITEFLEEKCGLPIDRQFVSQLVNLRADIIHARSYDPMEVVEVASKVQYLNRMILFEILANFDPQFQKYLIPHTHRLNILEWDRF